MEAGRGVGDQRAQQHGHTVAGVVLRCKGRGHFRAVPIESAGQDGLGKIRVGQPVCPLALPLEAARHRVAAQRLLVPAQLVQLRVAVQDVPHHHRHLGDELPVLVRGHDLGPGNDLRQVFARVAVKALAAIGLYPGQRPFVFLRIVNPQRDAAHDLRHIHPFGAHPEIFLEQLRVAEAARNAHCDTAQVHIGLVFHPAHGHGAARKTKNLFGHVGGDRRIRRVLHVVPVNGKCGQAPLGMGCHHGCQIHRARAFGSVEAPHSLDRLRVHVERLCAVAPAGCDGQCGHHVLRAELLGYARGLCASADGGAANDALHRLAVRVTQRSADELRSIVRHRHGLVLQAFAHAAPAAVDDRADPDFRIQHLILSLIFCYFSVFPPRRSRSSYRTWARPMRPCLRADIPSHVLFLQ